MPELDPDIATLIAAAAAADPPVPKITELAPAEARRHYAGQTAALAGPPVAVSSTTDTTIPGPAGPIPVRVTRPAEPSGAAIVFLHGGGWVIGDLDTHDTATRRLAAGTGAVVIAVDYRLAPEHRFPAAVEDAHAALAHVAAHAADFGVDPARIAVAGDSAGGNLAAVLAHLARDEGFALTHQLLIYPATTGRTDTPSYEANSTGALLERATMDWFYDHYARDDADRDNPLFAPLRAPNLAGLAPATIVTAGFDPLRDDGRLYAEALEKSGVPVRLIEYERLTHGFFLMGGVSAAARAAIEEVVKDVL